MTSDNQGIEVGVQVVVTGPDAFGKTIAIGRSGEVTHIFGNSPDCKVIVKGATFRAPFHRSSLELAANKSDNQGGVPETDKCPNCGGVPGWAEKHQGYCFDCWNTGIPDLHDEILSLRDRLAKAEERVRELEGEQK